MSREDYWKLINPTPDRSREIRMLVRLRAFLLLWIIFVIGVFAPPVWLLALAVPVYLRIYRRRIALQPGHFARGAKRAEAMFGAGW